jgi:U32 family peptidase
MELLAPVGNPENFHAALDAGADAVYVGAPELNARNLARDLKLEEIGAMIRFCHERGKRLYVAANSLILEQELPKVIETLAFLETLEPDALIVQDLGIISLVREYFPGLSLHASTLMLAHNADAVRMLSLLGCSRVVLARELTLKEISAIARTTDVQLEVFVHGAMCFSYSGLCLFSSFLGGKSGLRGRCVQPCRRRYQWQGRGTKGGRGKGGSYLFSMNDLSGLEVIPELRRVGITSLKIEGRLRSAHYVSQVVRAYRRVLDADDVGFDAALEEAKILVHRAMGRTVASGYFFTPQPKEAITPHYSGNIGLHLGRMKTIVRQGEESYGLVTLKDPVAIGDRLRLHFESTGDRLAFRLKEIQVEGRQVRHADAGSPARLLLPNDTGSRKPGRIELYKIDVHARTGGSSGPDLKIDAVKRELVKNRRKLASRIRGMQVRVGLPVDEGHERKADKEFSRGRGWKASSQRKGGGFGLPLEWWLKTDSPPLVLGKLPLVPDHLLLTLDKNMVAQAGRIRQHLGRQVKKVIWALPPVLVGAEFGRMRNVVASLIRSGFKSFQIGHLSQIAMFGKERVHLFGDYTLNLMNDQAVRLAGRSGLEAAQLAIELDRESLRNLLKGSLVKSDSQKTQEHTPASVLRTGLTVYGAPPLFTARIAADHFDYNRVLTSPKGESFAIRKKEWGTQTFPGRPFSLLPYLRELKEMGLGYVVIDLTGLPVDKKGLQELTDRISGKGRTAKLPTFNYLGKLE